MRENELGNYLKLLRIKSDLTMTQTAGMTGITQGYISQIENGIYTPSAKTLAKLARAYNIPEIHLLRKAGIVQASRAVSDSPDTQLRASVFDAEPLSELADNAELLDLLKRGLQSLEVLSDQIRQRSQSANLASAPTMLPGLDTVLSRDLTLPVYDSGWQPLLNAAGETAGFPVPAHLCADDTEAFVLAVGDNAMAPLVNQGDWVVISPGAKLASGQVVALNDRNQLQLRNYVEGNNMVALTPLNHEYAAKTLFVDKKDRVDIAGRVLRIVNREL
jgi:transcriptional regulator with XRE-family HTH domain